jgi:hypothetical protein
MAGAGVSGAAFVGISAAKAFPLTAIIIANATIGLCTNRQRMFSSLLC